MANWAGSEETELDRRNQQRTFSLASKVSQLRSVALDLEHETLEHNRLLDGMDADFGSGGSLLNSSFNRLRGVVYEGKKNRKLLCYSSLCVVLLLVLFYYLLSGNNVD